MIYWTNPTPCFEREFPDRFHRSRFLGVFFSFQAFVFGDIRVFILYHDFWFASKGDLGAGGARPPLLIK
jgi:hypothetical protein